MGKEDKKYWGYLSAYDYSNYDITHTSEIFVIVYMY